MRLFTPAKFSGLDGMRFPASRNHKPTKDEMADYLDAYAARFELPIRTGVRVSRIIKKNGGFVVEAGGERLEAGSVIVATGAAQVPSIPSFAEDLDPAIAQLHSLEYRTPSQVPPGPVLVVGCGNSGAEISIELSHTHPTMLAGTERGHVPFDIDGFAARFLVYGVRFVGHHVLSRRTPIGRKAAAKLVSRGVPLVRTKPKQIVAAGVQRVARVAGARDGRPLLEDGSTPAVRSIVWCTGFRHDFSWIDVPVFEPDGLPRHERGIVREEPGLCFMGLPFQFSVTSETILGAGRDAAHIAAHIAAHSGAHMRERVATG